MIKIGKNGTGKTLEFVFDKNGLRKEIVKEFGYITSFMDSDSSFVFAGKETDFDDEKIKLITKKIIDSVKNDIQIDLHTFSRSGKLNINLFIQEFVNSYEFKYGKIFSMKKPEQLKKPKITLISKNNKEISIFKEAKIIAEARTYARDLQIMPPNYLNSVSYANKIEKDFVGIANLTIKILDKKQITKNKMNLLLSVNNGSAYHPRVAILEYKGNPLSKNKVAIVGKGITFDSGGYNIKTGKFMSHMKYDMSGSAIVAGTIKAIAKLGIKKNVVGVLVLTDNMISPKASTPDMVFKAMNNKTVEINNTDAEGRLALADGLTYSVKKLKAKRLIDVATLTGAVISALGSTYTGVWTTTDKAWEDMDIAAKTASENIWRMPMHNDFLKYMKGSKVADLKNTDLTGKAGASSAAMFLNEFTEGVEYIHMDVAGTADVNDTPKAPMIKTLVELIKQ